MIVLNYDSSHPGNGKEEAHPSRNGFPAGRKNEPEDHDPDGGAEGLIYDSTGTVCVNVCAFVEGHRRRVS